MEKSSSFVNVDYAEGQEEEEEKDTPSFSFFSSEFKYLASLFTLAQSKCRFQVRRDVFCEGQI